MVCRNNLLKITRYLQLNILLLKMSNVGFRLKKYTIHKIVIFKYYICPKV